jgi:uncharacterized protein (TIRG00374 family)
VNKPSTRRLVLTILRFLISGGLLVYLVWQADPATIWEAWRNADLRLIGLAVALQLLGLAISAFKWYLLLRSRGYTLPFAWVGGVYLVGQFTNNFLPTSIGGDAVRVVQLGRRIGSYTEAGSSIFIERLTGFLALSLIANAALVISSTDLLGMRLVSDDRLSLAAGLVSIAAIVAVGVSFASSWLLNRFGTWLPALIRRPLQQVADSLSGYTTNPRLMLQVVAISLLFHTIWISLHMAAGAGLGIAAPALIYFLMVPLTDIVGLLPIFFNNVGARDLIFTLYLSQIGVPDATALALAFTAFSIRLATSALGGIVLLTGGVSIPAPAETGESSPEQ